MTERPQIALEPRARQESRLSSPSAARNRQAIAAVLGGVLPADARVLEIASGTGEHALACVTARPDLAWTPSEPDGESRASVDAWAAECGNRIAPCLTLSTTSPDWAGALGPFDAVFCANMIHIAPWQAAEGLFAGAQTCLRSGGLVCLYGPFKDGEATAPSNLDFDASLKARDPRWGVRPLSDVEALAARHGFAFLQRHDMPANNLMLVYAKSGS
jgi:hypothetical protein